MAIDRARIEAAVVELLHAIGEDPTKANFSSTPERVAEAYAEFFAGVGQDPLEHLRESVPIDQLSDAVVVTDITVRSMCEHHLLPFLGVAHVAYLPGDRVVGLGKLPRVVNTLAARPQMQESLTEQIADALVEGLDPRGVLVVVEARHQCVAARGVEQTNSRTITIASRGELTEPAARSEIMTLIGLTGGDSDD
ncbi:MAG: GTP cyclohydrolase I FolE [Aurantimicrobium sp.]|jgi:GTP cyclohydrolase I|uniref:GTP cyclohydrolase I FolE n=1 Tax=Aurantimicrobium TaxID=1705353 RepID=UPI002405E1DC|nr:GTP cyclohydrolase I FolE [Aurantimicrobium minutum]MDF9809819.1 GTP cyclohydrolase I [Aurantimicrobium minutum]MDH6254709.1 GTP cyclohydrolase I [Aurantimicrobium minutum]MDH6410529.1 GTP cyclohydrolase I [Aurantimicrobium minutum]MDH6425342.1 GTP cyclohydrolase I [Aurantimicrobium minutum]MDH6536903.1 GTP cyclohydrolase I [Aurantimicrobium minutum]